MLIESPAKTVTAAGQRLDGHRQRAEPLAVGVADDARRGDADLPDPVVLVRRMRHVGALEQPRIDPEQLELAHRLDDHHVQHAIVEQGALAHPQPAAVRRAVADRDQHRVELPTLAVELERVGQRLEDPQLGQGRQVVAHLAPSASASLLARSLTRLSKPDASTVA